MYPFLFLLKFYLKESLFEDALRMDKHFFFSGRALKISSGIDDFGTPKWDMTLCLLLAWILCFLCLLKGIKTTGKVGFQQLLISSQRISFNLISFLRTSSYLTFCLSCE